MESKKYNLVEFLMWGLILGTIGFADYVYNSINLAMQAL